MAVHAPYCQEAMARQSEEYERHIRTFGGEPCDQCGGNGWVGYYEYGQFFGDDCPSCVGRGDCPRCESAVTLDTFLDGYDAWMCDTCGFIQGKSSPGASPPECICYDDYEFHNIEWDDAPPF